MPSHVFEFPSTSEDQITYWLSDYNDKEVAKKWRHDSYAAGVALDEIPKDLPGCLRTKQLLGITTLKCAQEAIKDLIQADRVAAFWEPRESGSAILTDEEHIDHLKTLNEAGVIAFDHVGILHWSRYFPILKSNGLARAIFDCRDFNKCCKDAPYLNLLRIDVLLSMLSAENWSEFFMHQFDLRHNFYQLGVSEELSRHFGVQCGGIVGRCVCVPMGWKRAPYCCLSINYAMCVAGMGKHLHVRIPDAANASPPAYLEIMNASGERVGWIFVWYDNICIFSKDAKIGMDWVLHIRKQLLRFKAYVKQDELSNVFLGLRFMTSEGHLYWTHADLAKYQNAWVSYDSSRRDIAHSIGIVLWDKAVSGIPWWEIKDVLKASQAIGREATTRRMWNEISPLPPNLEKAVNRGVQKVLKGQLYTRTSSQRDCVKYASDASKAKVAFVLLDESGVNECTAMHQPVYDSKFIFLLELRAARMAVQHAARNHRSKRMYLAVDNKGVFHALRKGFTLVQEAEDDFDMLQDALSDGDVELIPVFVPGTCNVADSPTRGKPLSRRRLRDTLEYIRAVAQGHVAWRKDDESDQDGNSDEEGPEND